MLARARFIEQGQRRQFARLRRIEQRQLTFALHPIALRRLWRGRLDARRLPRGHLLLLLSHSFLARLLTQLTGGKFAALLDALLQPLERGQNVSAEPVHDGEPRDTEE